MLYPVMNLDAETAAREMNTLPSGTLAVIPLHVVQMTQITLIQASGTQDYSLRGWISVFPDGVALGFGIFPILRVSYPLVVHLVGETPPAGCDAIAVAPGDCVLNILNLTNEANMFAFSKTDLA